MLILQGEHDANVPPDGAAHLDAALTSTASHTLRSYPDLGHSLGPAEDAVRDNFRPMADAPLSDLTSWLDKLPSAR